MSAKLNILRSTYNSILGVCKVYVRQQLKKRIQGEIILRQKI